MILLQLVNTITQVQATIIAISKHAAIVGK